MGWFTVRLNSSRPKVTTEPFTKFRGRNKGCIFADIIVSSICSIVKNSKTD